MTSGKSDPVEAGLRPGVPVMLPADGGRVISGGAVHARLLVAHDHPAYASPFALHDAHGRPGPSAVRDLEARYGTEQITAMRAG